MHIPCRKALAVGALLWLVRPVCGQTTFATITGTVNDATGAIVTGVTVTATHIESNIETKAQSNEAGLYTLAQLKEGAYLLRASRPGFKEFVARDITLAARDIRRLDIRLEVGSVETVVEVQGGATLIETETARISDNKDTRLLNTLPLNTRSPFAFLALSPGIQEAPGSSTRRFSGSRANQGHWAIDGTTMSDGVNESQISPLANFIESFEEIKIDLSNNSAEFGTIGQVTIISKSGSNSLHGSLFDYYSTPWFRARNPFALSRGTGITHQVGGSVGGPVVFPKAYNGRNKTFFFFSFETSRGSQASQALNPAVPIAAWRQGDFAGLSGGVLIYDPQGGQPFPNNRIPASRINAVSQKIQDRFYPLPNFGNPSVFQTQNYREVKTRPFDPSTYSTSRVDHRFSASDSIFGRFTFNRQYSRGYEGNLPTIGRRFQQRDDRAGTFSYTHVFRPTLLNEFRWGFGLNNNPVIGPLIGPDVVKDLGLVGLAPDLPTISGLLKVNWSGLGLQAITQADYTKPGFRNHLEDFQDHVSWFRGRHNIKLGFNLTRVEYDDLAANANLFGSVTFSNRFTSAGLTGQGHPYADFLLGIPTSSARAFAPIERDRNRWQYDLYAVDDFKLSSTLTLNLGMRYELHLPWRENANRMAMFDIGTGSIVVPDQALSSVSPLMPKNYVNVVTASSVHLASRTVVNPDKNNLAPRVGIAYRPWGPKTVFRMGYGIFYNVVPLTLSIGGIPYVLNEPSYTNPTSNPDVIFPRVFPATGAGGPSTVGLPTATDPNLRTPYSMQYNFTIERQMWDTGFRISYIGTNERKGWWNYNYNSPVPDARPFVDKPRPFPNYPGITYTANGAGHQYNGLTLTAERHFSKGLYFQGSWTWARDRYDMDYDGDLSSFEYTAENPFDRHRDIGVSSVIPTHRVTSNWVYQLPFGRGRHWLPRASRLLNLAAGGWEISGIYSMYSGQFLTPFWTGPDPVGIAFTSSRTPAQVTIRPDALHDPNLPTDQRSVTRWYDLSAFSGPQLGQFGSASKGMIKGPGVNVWHMGLHKDFFFKENGAHLRWETTATNIFNHPNFSNPGTDITSSGSAAVISGVGGVNGEGTGDQPGARAFRMALRFEW